jgi:dynein heavy chain 1
MYSSKAKLYNEKRSDLEEQQLHLNIGLQKIKETVDQVGDLQKSLSVKRLELEEKNAAANAKLKQMVNSDYMSITYEDIHISCRLR